MSENKDAQIAALKAKDAARDAEINELTNTLQTMAENLAATGLRRVENPISLAERYNVGYRRGYADALNHVESKFIPLWNAFRDLEIAVAYASVSAGMLGVQRADFRDALRPFADVIAREMYDRYRNLDALLARHGGSVPEILGQDVTAMHEALIMFATGRDNGEALAACDVNQITNTIRETLAALKMGGPAGSEGRAWLGEQIYTRRKTHKMTYRAAIEAIYRELIARERSHELLEDEAKALKELDARDHGDVFRTYGNLPSRIVEYCKGAAADWRKRNRSANAVW